MKTMTNLSNECLKTIGREVAQSILRDRKVDAVDVTLAEDSTDQPTYYFWYRIDRDQDRKVASLLRTRLSQKLRDELLGHGDAHYPIVRWLSSEEWERRGVD